MHPFFEATWDSFVGPVPAPLVGLCACLRCRSLAVHHRSGLFAELLSLDVQRRSAIVDVLGRHAFMTMSVGSGIRGEHACT
jgi:hypothetical protein